MSRLSLWPLACGPLVAGALISCQPEVHEARLSAIVRRARNDLERVQQLFDQSRSTFDDLGEVLLYDPFGEGTTYRLSVVNDEVVLYSIGPDRVDDGGAASYDPTNGAYSHGDIRVVLRPLEIQP